MIADDAPPIVCASRAACALVLAGACMLAGCRDAELRPVGEGGEYDCGDLQFTVRVDGDQVVAQIPGRELVLREFVGATGPRYSDGQSELLFEGERATLQHDGQTHVCNPVTP